MVKAVDFSPHMMKRIRDLYTPPFRVSYDYVNDAKGNMVADFIADGVFRPRGAGRMKYMEDSTLLHDSCECFLLTIMKDLVKPTNRDDKDAQAIHVEALNNKWADMSWGIEGGPKAERFDPNDL